MLSKKLVLRCVQKGEHVGYINERVNGEYLYSEMSYFMYFCLSWSSNPECSPDTIRHMPIYTERDRRILLHESSVVSSKPTCPMCELPALRERR